MSSGIAEAPEPRTGTTFTEANLKEQVLLVVSKFSNPPAPKKNARPARLVRRRSVALRHREIAARRSPTEQRLARTMLVADGLGRKKPLATLLRILLTSPEEYLEFPSPRVLSFSQLQ